MASDPNVEQFADTLVENMERVFADAVATMDDPPEWSDKVRDTIIQSMVMSAWGVLKCSLLGYADGGVAAARDTLNILSGSIERHSS